MRSISNIDNKEIIVVDNGSSDKSQEWINYNYPNIKIIHNQKNLGVTNAWNQGLELSSGRYVCIANNDLSFFAHMNRNIMKTIMHISPETIEKMADSFITAYKEEPNSSIFSHPTNQEGESLVTSFMESSPAIIYEIMKAHIEKGDCSIFQYTNSNCLTTLLAHKPTVIVELIDNYLKQNKKDILTQKNKNNQDILEMPVARE